jgi:hypothetical protein
MTIGGALAVAAIALVALFYAGVIVPANFTQPHHAHENSPAYGRAVNGLSNDKSLLTDYHVAGGGRDSDGVVYDRWCNGSPAAVEVKRNGHWHVAAVDHHCSLVDLRGAFFYTDHDYAAHRTASLKNGHGNWIWGPVSRHPQ